MGAEVPGQANDGGRGNVGGGPAPSRMYGRGHVVFGIGQEDGDAVGGLHSDPMTGLGGDEAIGLGIRGLLLQRKDPAGVDLPERAAGSGGSGEGGAEAMIEPRVEVEQRGPVRSGGSAVETHATGCWTWAIMTCFWKSASMASSSRTSVGRLTKLIWSILSCSLSRA